MLHDRAPAKINLFLHVTGRRADGYHLLESIFVFANVYDRLGVVAHTDITLEVTGPYACQAGLVHDNLVLLAAQRLHQEAGLPDNTGARIRLEKHLPVAAGLGGGSSDAACALRLLSKLWNISLSDKEILELALALGADVPACLDPGPKFVSGIGENLHSTDPFPFFMLLVNPGIPLSTARVFQRRAELDPDFNTQALFNWRAMATTGAVHEMLAGTMNDLQASACDLSPEIGKVVDIIRRQPGCELSRMSGSGATCFGLFPDIESAILARDEIRLAHPDWWVWAGSEYKTEMVL